MPASFRWNLGDRLIKGLAGPTVRPHVQFCGAAANPNGAAHCDVWMRADVNALKDHFVGLELDTAPTVMSIIRKLDLLERAVGSDMPCVPAELERWIGEELNRALGSSIQCCALWVEAPGGDEHRNSCTSQCNNR